MPLAREVVQDLAVEHGACVRPVQLRRTNLDTAEIEQVLANGPLMARLSSVDLTQRSGLTSRSAVNPTALAARGAVVPIGPSLTNVFDGSAVNDAARW